jgi:hypothetical protein
MISDVETSEHFRYLKWRFCTIFLAIFCGDIPLALKNRPSKKVGSSNESVPVAWPLMVELLLNQPDIAAIPIFCWLNLDFLGEMPHFLYW